MKRFLSALCICLLVIAATSLTACDQVKDFVNDKIPGLGGDPQVFNITFVDHDGTVIETIQVAENQEIAFPGENPTREADAQYTYQFVGWANAEGTVLAQLPLATEDMQFTAFYNKTVNSYTVEFKNGDQLLQTETLEYGTVPTFKGEVPGAEADDQYSYVFSGWTDGSNHYATNIALPVVTGNVTYQANFSSTLNSYTVTWNVLGEETSVDFVYGSVPTFEGTPEKPGTAQFTYTFAGWAITEDGEVLTDEQMTVVADVVYYAVFTETVNSYKVTFVDENDNELFSEDVEYGVSPEFKGTLPTLNNDAQYSYEYLGWVVEDAVYSFQDTLPTVTGEATYKLKLETTVNEYKVVWVVDGQETEKVLPYGATPEFKGTPAKDKTAEYEYEFMGWSLTEGGEITELATVTGDATYHAIFKAVKNHYEIKFVDGEGEELYKTTLDYGAAVAFVGTAPEKAPTAQYTFVPAWMNGNTVYEADKLPAVSGATTYVLTYIEVINKYDITINYQADGNASAPASKVVTLDYGTAYGKAETESPTVSGMAPDYYWFAGILTEDVSYTVKYHAVDVWDGTTATEFASGSGTEADPYIIKTGAQLAYLAKLGMDNTAAKDSVYGTDIYYKLGASLDLSGYQWTPIALREDTTTYNWTYFDGHFDGAGHTIILNISNTGFGYGLFQGLGATSVVKDLTLSGVVSCAHRAGALAYITQDGATIENVTNYADVTTTSTATTYSGGIIGSFSGAETVMNNCANYGTVTGAGAQTGGLTGNSAGTISNSVNYGAINSTAGTSAGIAGYLTGTVLNCVNYGTVDSISFTGGIVGNVSKATIEGCINYGAVSGTTAVGGITGQSASSTTTKLCVNYGEVNGAGHNVAGVSGYVGAGSSVLGCVNYGEVANTSADTGGIAGENQGYVGAYVDENETVHKTINYGYIHTTATNVGGITGYNYKDTATTADAENYGKVYGEGSYVGGIVGENSKGLVENGINYADIEGNASYIAGAVGRNNSGTATNLTNYGNITALKAASKTGTGIGGVIGSNQVSATASKLYNYGDVIGYNQVGGVSGYQGAGSTIDEAVNNGKVYGYSSYTGQIVGQNNAPDETTNVTENGSAEVIVSEE